MATCLDNYWGASNPAERVNLTFFIKLRNKIEHRSMPSLDSTIFGECQALLFNFEDLLTSEFSAKYAMNESLSLALQFSRLRSEVQDSAIRQSYRPLAKDVTSFVDRFRSSLGIEMLQDQRYSYKVFLIPKVANHQSSSDVAVEFVKYDLSKPEEMARYDRLVSLIKPSAAATANPAMIGPGPIRLVNDPKVPVVRAINYDDTHPNRQKDLVAKVNTKLPKGMSINPHDIAAVRHAHGVDAIESYFHRPRFGSPQYSDSFAEWLVESFKNDSEFFNQAREKYQQDRRAKVSDTHGSAITADARRAS